MKFPGKSGIIEKLVAQRRKKGWIIKTGLHRKKHKPQYLQLYSLKRGTGHSLLLS